MISDNRDRIVEVEKKFDQEVSTLNEKLLSPVKNLLKKLLINKTFISLFRGRLLALLP
jgi:hypothetical protein